MRNSKKSVIIYLSLLLICVVIFASNAFATAADTDGSNIQNQAESLILSKDSDYSSYPYVLNSYDVNITVKENNTFSIVEKISAYFNEPKHGIYRTIPLQNRVERLDGTVSNNRIKIRDIKVDAAYSTSIESGSEVIKIGDANTTLTGAQNYVVSYVYDMGKDTGKNYDEIYFNLIGKEWDTAIGGITFTITMPKAFDGSKVGFSRGLLGSQENIGIDFQVEGNVISGSYNGILNPGESLTMRVELPEAYFLYTGSNLDLFLILSFLLPILFVLLAMFLWIRFGKDKKVIETVEFYPPEGFNSAEIGFLYKGTAENNDAISLLIYLANKGYIKISEIEEHALFIKSKAFKLTKLKDYDGDNENERLFLKDLFRTAKKPTIVDLAKLIKSFKNPKIARNIDTEDLYENHNEVTSEDLKNSFYLTLNKIIANLNRKENKHKIFERNSLGKGFIGALMIVGIYILITVKPVVEYVDASILPFALIFPGIGFTALFAMVFGKTKWSLKVFGFIWGLGFGGMPWAMMVLPALLADPIYLVAYITGLVCVFIIVMMFKIMPKRTTYGNELLGKIRGFRTFLETAEKSKLEALVLQDPAYFYDILPFTYVLGVSDKWIKKFEVIALPAPGWYDSNTNFNMTNFGVFMGSTMTTASTAMSSSPSGSGSGSSGGGSSGGGSGGGGGGSW